jgi:hypothetical protein
MQLRITRLPSDDRTYSIATGSGTRYGVRDFELKRWLLNLGVGDSTIAAVLDIEPNETTTLQVAKAA